MSIRHGRHAVVSKGGIAVLAFGSAAIVGRMVFSGATRGFDHQCRHAALRRRTKTVKRAAKLFSTVGEPAAQVSLAVLASLDFARSSKAQGLSPSVRNVSALSAPLISSLVGIAAHRSIKLLFKRRRPPGALKTEPSFPSGHTTVTTAAACTIAYAARARGIRSAYVVPTALLLSVCVGLSRIFLDEHWATDVIGGWCIGIAIASGTATLVNSSATPPTRPMSPTNARAKVRRASLAQ